MGKVFLAMALSIAVLSSPVTFDIPEGDTSPKAYMSYKCITDTSSSQYKLQSLCWTDSNGLRRYSEGKTDYYVVAMGTYYADSVGDKFLISLDSGKKLPVIVGDIKAPEDTVDNQYHWFGSEGKNVIEFIVDTSELDREAKLMGDISYIGSLFEGAIEDISLVERA